MLHWQGRSWPGVCNPPRYDQTELRYFAKSIRKRLGYTDRFPRACCDFVLVSYVQIHSMFCTPTPRQNFPATPLRIATHNGKDLDANAVLIDDVKLDCVGPLPSQTKAFLQCRIQELVVGNGWSVEPLTSPPLCPFPSLFFILLSGPLKSCWLGRSPVAKNTMHFDFSVKIVSGCNNLPGIYDDVTVKFRDGGIFHAQKNCCMPVGDSSLSSPLDPPMSSYNREVGLL